METIAGLNDLIKNRLIEKRGSIKLSDHPDILLYGRALGFSENDLLFKILEVEETINWNNVSQQAQGADHEITNTSIFSHNQVASAIIYCTRCNAANDKNSANFCIDCGNSLQIKTHVQTNVQTPTPEITSYINRKEQKQAVPYWLLGLLFLILLFLAGIYINEKWHQKKASAPTAADSLEVSVTPDPADVEVDIMPSVQLTNDEVLDILTRYYIDLNDNNFSAYNYFSNQVAQYIMMKNTTPDEINRSLGHNNEYQNGHSQIIDGQIFYDRTINNIAYYKYWIDYQCYRASKNQNQFCKVLIEVGFNADKEIYSFKELKVSNLIFEPVYETAAPYYEEPQEAPAIKK